MSTSNGQPNPYTPFLGRMAIFKGLSNEKIEHLADEFDVVDVEAGAALFSEGDKPNYFFILYSGRLKVLRGTKSVKELATFGPGDHVGEEAFLYNTRRTATVTAEVPSRLLRLNPKQFSRLMRTYPSLRMFLLASIDSRRLARKMAYTWLAAGETIYLMARKHLAYLFVALFLPSLAGFLGLVLLLFGLTIGNNSVQMVIEMAGAALVIVAGAWALWNYLDWGNDYYIVTNQRVVVLEKVIGLYDSRQEAPLGTVLTVGTTRDSLGRILGYGNVNIRTFTGEIVMRRVGMPIQLAGLIEEQLARSKVSATKAETQKLETAIRRRLGIAPPPGAAAAPAAPTPAPAVGRKKPKRPSPFKSFRDLFKVRIEQGNVVTFRKHWILLLRKAWFPTLGIFLLLIFMVVRIAGFLTFVSIPLMLLTTITFMVVLAGVWAYQYVDWINDIYQVTPDQIIDVYRKPLGEEDKKTAPLENILSLEHERIGILGLLLNYGNVIATVGGVKFTFDGVYDPPGVQQVIFQYINARKKAMRDADADRERERIADWMAAYHNQVEEIRRSQKPPGNS